MKTHTLSLLHTFHDTRAKMERARERVKDGERGPATSLLIHSFEFYS